jgi:ribosome assembly protein YihI (activator of Der GTPase)
MASKLGQAEKQRKQKRKNRASTANRKGKERQQKPPPPLDTDPKIASKVSIHLYPKKHQPSKFSKRAQKQRKALPCKNNTELEQHYPLITGQLHHLAQS